MKCPYCSNETKVIDSREMGDEVRRRRECVSCRARFTGYERVHMGNLFVIKKDGRREEFTRDKLLLGIRRACEKRPLPTGSIDKLADDIEADIYHLGKAEVPASLIGDLVMARLKELDYIAYVRFASVYHEFADITALKQVVDSMVAGVTKPHQSQLRLPF